MTDDKNQTHDSPTKIDWLKTAAGALAAVTTAVLLSTLGAAGTLIGAALGSVAVTVSSQLYAQGLTRSKRTMAKAQESALLKVGIAQAEVRRAGRRQDETGAVEAHLEAADDRLDQARAELDVVEPVSGARERLLLLPWKKIGLTAAGLFLVALVAIASFEALTGRSVSSYTGGSDQDSGSTFTGNGSSDDDGGDRKDEPKPDPTDSPSEPTPTDEPTSEAPTEEPSETPTEEPSETPSETPTEDPTGLPTLPTPTPTATP